MTPLPAAPCHFQAASLPFGPLLSFLFYYFLFFFLIFCVHGQMGGKVRVADGKTQAEIWIFPKSGITVPGLTLQTGSDSRFWGCRVPSARAFLLGFVPILLLTLPERGSCLLLAAGHPELSRLSPDASCSSAPDLSFPLNQYRKAVLQQSQHVRGAQVIYLSRGADAAFEAPVQPSFCFSSPHLPCAAFGSCAFYSSSPDPPCSWHYRLSVLLLICSQTKAAAGKTPLLFSLHIIIPLWRKKIIMIIKNVGSELRFFN